MEITASSSDPIRQLDELKTFYQLRIAELQCEVKILKQKLNSSCEDYEDEINNLKQLLEEEREKSEQLECELLQMEHSSSVGYQQIVEELEFWKAKSIMLTTSI